MKTIPNRTGNPSDPPRGTIADVPEGVGFTYEISARGYDDQPLPDAENLDLIVTLARATGDKQPAEEWHIWDTQIALVDAADSRFRISFSPADAAVIEANGDVLHYWTEPRDGSQDRMLQARDDVPLIPAVEPAYLPPPRLVGVGFPDLIAPVDDGFYVVNPRDGFRGGKRPIGYVSTIDGVTAPINGTLQLDREALMDRDITITAMDARGDVVSETFRHVNEPTITAFAPGFSVGFGSAA